MIITPTVPLTQSDNAGGNFFSSLISQLADNEITLIVPESGKGSETAPFPSVESVIVIPEQPLSDTPLVRRLQGRLERLAPLRPPRGFLRGLHADPQARAVLRDADVIDIEWPALSWSIRGIAALAPSARIIATLHDVPSQGLWREYLTVTSIKERIRLLANAMQAEQLERRVLRRADSVVVFSEKDRGLLGFARNVDVLLPWIPGFEPNDPAESAAATPIALFIGPLRRMENWDAAMWLCHEIWPVVRQRLPHARLRFVGSSTRSQRELLEQTPGVDAVGFADDLGAEYRNATVAVMPLRLGAGLKFKVLEAMTSGLPFVATSTATEGVGDHEFAPASFDDPQRFADEVVRVLTSANAERETASDRLRWAHSRYGELPFERAVTAIYGESSETAPATREHYDVSVVVPVFNGEHLLSHQLAALARQAEAKDLDIVIADNGSSDRTRQVALAYGDAFGALRVVDAGDRRGVNHARNVGLAAARGDKVLICDHDDEVHAGWVGALAQALERADVVGGHAVAFFPSRPHPQQGPIAELGDPLQSVLGYLPYAFGGSLGVRRAAALAVGGFDETFVGGHDEADFCWRLQEAGYAIKGEPTAVLSYRQRDRARDAYRQSRSSARTRILLWVRFARTGAPVSPVSFRGAIHQCLLATGDVVRLARSDTRREAAKGIGWALGTLEGHWRYRLRGRVPARVLMSSSRRAEDSASLPHAGTNAGGPTLPLTVSRTREPLSDRARLPRASNASCSISYPAGHHDVPTSPAEKKMMSLKTPALTVIIPVRNGASLIGQQLSALSQQENAPDFEVVVSDNGSTDDLLDVINRWSSAIPSLRLVDSGDKKGVAHARNIGVLAARAPSIAICDADDVVDRGWVAAIARTLAQADAAAGTCRHDQLNSPDAYGNHVVLAPVLLAGGGLSLFGGNFGVRRDAYLSIGGTDEAFNGGCEDDDFSRRLHRAGYRALEAPDAIVQVRLRDNDRDTFIRNRRFGRESIRERLLEREESVTPRPLSFKASMFAVPRYAFRWARARFSGTPERQILFEEFAYTVGQVQGHLKYRGFGRLAPRELMDRDSTAPADIPLRGASPG